MHTTNNVPQSRCRAFLIYGELSEMGRWSKRRWRHAVGLHFSLFSPHKQEKPVSVCHNTPQHSPTHTAQRHKHMHKCSTTPTIYMHTSHFHHRHTLIPTFSTGSHSPLQLKTKHTWIHPPPLRTCACTHTHTLANP